MTVKQCVVTITMTAALVAGATALVSALLAGGAWRSGWVQLNRPDPAQFPVRGIDVSHHQGEIDWAKVAGAGVRFAYLKATEGRDLRDPRPHGARADNPDHLPA